MKHQEVLRVEFATAVARMKSALTQAIAIADAALAPYLGIDIAECDTPAEAADATAKYEEAVIAMRQLEAKTASLIPEALNRAKPAFNALTTYYREQYLANAQAAHDKRRRTSLAQKMALCSSANKMTTTTTGNDHSASDIAIQ